MWHYIRIRFAGRLNQKSYVVAVICQFGLIVLDLIAGSILLELLDAESDNASDIARLLAVAISIIASAVFVYGIAAMLGSIARRARDTSLYVLWLMIGLLAPCGLAVLALVPSRQPQRTNAP